VGRQGRLDAGGNSSACSGSGADNTRLKSRNDSLDAEVRDLKKVMARSRSARASISG
jgi:hypothetical protein